MTTSALDHNNNQNESKTSKNTQKTKRAAPLREADTANYIADMILELRNLAKSSDLQTLQGLLEISYYEAFSCANNIEIPKGEEQFIHDLGADARKAVAAG